ncbi:MAG: hypothetical protein FHOMOCKG_00075 [Methanophagales virus GBV302]|uniref:Uncharacterized protein n=1 Tax=Methanophagales virus GBV302 TaxID=2999281 RepID=A0A9E8VG98_9CAUD|nr:MAG: hypothetical protein QIT37_gp075 [Methanophagales virus GBV302]WAE39603.1 MAG: hypothetical protein FHOMOCKG_00075 [Methanophagales virus GBV302]
MAEVEDVVAGAPVIVTFLAGADIEAGQVVGYDVSASPDDMTVAPALQDGYDTIPVGVAVDSVAEDDPVPVAIPPSIVRVRASSNVTAGQLVQLNESDAGQVEPYNSGDNTWALGQALEDITADSTGRVRLLLTK